MLQYLLVQLTGELETVDGEKAERKQVNLILFYVSIGSLYIKLKFSKYYGPLCPGMDFDGWEYILKDGLSFRKNDYDRETN